MINLIENKLKKLQAQLGVAPGARLLCRGATAPAHSPHAAKGHGEAGTRTAWAHAAAARDEAFVDNFVKTTRDCGRFHIIQIIGNCLKNTFK